MIIIQMLSVLSRSDKAKNTEYIFFHEAGSFVEMNSKNKDMNRELFKIHQTWSWLREC